MHPVHRSLFGVSPPHADCGSPASLHPVSGLVPAVSNGRGRIAAVANACARFAEYQSKVCRRSARR